MKSCFLWHLSKEVPWHAPSRPVCVPHPCAGVDFSKHGVHNESLEKAGLMQLEQSTSFEFDEFG